MLADGYANVDREFVTLGKSHEWLSSASECRKL